MTNYHRETEFLRLCLRYDDTVEQHELETRITKLQRDEICVRRAVWLMALFAALAMAGLCYAAVFVADYPANLSEFTARLVIKLLSACDHGALGNAAKKLGAPAEDSTVRAMVSLIEDDQGGYRLGVELHARLPGVDHTQAQRIMDQARQTCPYSKALRGDTSVKLVVD